MREREKEREREREKKIVYYANSTYVHEKVNTETDFLPYLVVIDKEQ